MDFYIRFKATIVIEYESAMPVAILIRSGAPHDTKIFHRNNGKPPKTMHNPKMRHNNIRPGYYKFENYQIGIPNKNRSFNFPPKKISIRKLNDKLTYHYAYLKIKIQ